jgi:hypothetical protein
MQQWRLHYSRHFHSETTQAVSYVWSFKAKLRLKLTRIRVQEWIGVALSIQFIPIKSSLIQ